MNPVARAVLLSVGIGAVISIAPQSSSPGQELVKVPPRPAPEVIAAWEQAGAEFGFVSVNIWGELFWRSGKTKSVAGDTTVFHVTKFPIGHLATLPEPDAPYGLLLDGFDLTDEELMQLANFPRLQTLALRGRRVTDAGLKEFAALTHLRACTLQYPWSPT